MFILSLLFTFPCTLIVALHSFALIVSLVFIVFAERIPKPSIHEWTYLLRVYFDDSNSRPPSTTGLIKSSLKHEKLNYDPDPRYEEYTKEHESNYFRTNVKAVSVLLFAFNQVSKITKMEEVAKILPFVIRLADDYDSNHRFSGLKMLFHLFQISPLELLKHMNLVELALNVMMQKLYFDVSRFLSRTFHLITWN